MKIFYDTEFVDDGTTIKLISIGMVAEDGREYYAISNNRFTMTAACRHDWVRDNVLPSLPVMMCDASTWTWDDSSAWTWDEHHPDYAYVKHTSEIAEQVRGFILATPDPQLWAWYAAYDHVAYAQLHGPMSQLPAGLPMFTCDLKQRALELGDPRVPEQETGQHNALADARHNQRISKFLDDTLAAMKDDNRAWTDQVIEDIDVDRLFERDRADKAERTLHEIREALRPVANAAVAKVKAAVELLDEQWPAWRTFATSCNCPGGMDYHAINCPAHPEQPRNIEDEKPDPHSDDWIMKDLLFRARRCEFSGSEWSNAGAAEEARRLNWEAKRYRQLAAVARDVWTAADAAEKSTS